MLDLYLSELERRARWSLASREIDLLVNDAREHLGASVQVRLEMGEASEVAERDGVVAFGHTKEIIQAANAVHRARFQNLFLVLSTFAGIVWAFAILTSPLLGRGAVGMMGGVFFTLLACFVECSKLRWPLLPVFGATAAFWLSFTSLCACWIREYSVEGWLRLRVEGPVDLIHTAFWSSVAAMAFLAYLLLAFRMAHPSQIRRLHG